MLSTLSTSQAAKRSPHGNNRSLATKMLWLGPVVDLKADPSHYRHAQSSGVDLFEQTSHYSVRAPLGALLQEPGGRAEF